MISKVQIWHRASSRYFGHWAGERRWRYACPVWANKDAYTHGFLTATGIIKA